MKITLLGGRCASHVLIIYTDKLSWLIRANVVLRKGRTIPALAKTKITQSFLAWLVCSTFLFVAGESFAVDCTPDEITLTTQQEVNEFQANHGRCDTVVGGLRVEGSDITSLLPLSGLSVIDGFFDISRTSVESLEGISGLTQVGDWFDIARNPNLLNLDDFPDIPYLDLNLLLNSSLQDIDGLSMYSGEINQLALQSNPQLNNIDGLLGITGINRHLIISNMALPDLHGLSNLEYVNGFVQIVGESIQSLEGLENLTTIGRSLIIGSSQPGFFGFSQLKNLDGLSGLQSVGLSLLIGGHPNLSNIDGLSNLQTIGLNFIVADTDLLTDLNGLSAVTTWGGGVRLERNNLLSDISVLANLPSSIAYLTLTSNDALTDISAFSHLTELRGRLFIHEAEFSDVSPLAGIQGVDGDFVLKYSSNIRNCNVFQTLLDRVDDFEPGPGPNSLLIPDVSGEIEIHSNAPGCNSLEEILTVFLKESFE